MDDDKEFTEDPMDETEFVGPFMKDDGVFAEQLNRSYYTLEDWPAFEYIDLTEIWNQITIYKSAKLKLDKII